LEPNHARPVSPINLRGSTLPNRIVVSPMCQYVAEDGRATNWHLIHLGNLALSGERTSFEAFSMQCFNC
jgi:2,4-dienoyl-CoA reductase-like NADH-dependent reductase (Old Yellow Enzyme family)